MESVTPLDNGPTMLDLLTFAGYWYLSGLFFVFIVSLLLIHDGEIEEIRIQDFERYFGWSVLGPIAGIFMLWIIFMKLTHSFREVYVSNRHRVLWRGKTSRSKAVLFGSKDDDDD